MTTSGSIVFFRLVILFAFIVVPRSSPTTDKVSSRCGDLLQSHGRRASQRHFYRLGLSPAADNNSTYAPLYRLPLLQQMQLINDRNNLMCPSIELGTY